MSDACGCGHDEPADEDEQAPGQWWQVRELQAAAAAAVFLLAAYIVGWAGGPQRLSLVLEWIALLIGAWTFVPSTLRRLAKETEEGKGTIGGLLKDPTVYQDLKRTLDNVERNTLLRALIRFAIKHDHIDRTTAGPVE